MNKFPLFLIITLIAVWSYTSWYWYTCNIKWACAQELKSEGTSIMREEIWLNQQNLSPSDTEQDTLDTSNVPSLSRDDVLIGESVIPQAVESQNDDTSQQNIDEQEEIPEINTATWEIINEREIPSWDRDAENDDVTQEVREEERIDLAGISDLCKSPLVWPISSGGANNTVEVKKLETFLIANAYLSGSDGIYGNADLEAVKQLQLDYKAQMLDPWGIDTPTWYVWSTTVATINSIWCKN